MCKVISGTSLEQNPRWMLDGRNVLIGPYYSADEHDQHIGQTIGSTDWLWSAADELRFDQETLLLQSASFIVPEATLPSDISLDIWKMVPQVTGLLQLSHAQNFQLESTDFRWLDPQGSTLTCVTRNALNHVQQRLRLSIAKNIELLFVDEQLCGWSLLNPTLFIVDAWEDSTVDAEDSQFTALLHTYLSLLTNPYIERMEDRDAPMLDNLRNLYAHIITTANHTKRYNILKAAVVEKIDLFYGLKLE
jgi:hypothetical protein